VPSFLFSRSPPAPAEPSPEGATLLSPGRESWVTGFYEGERRRCGTEFLARFAAFSPIELKTGPTGAAAQHDFAARDPLRPPRHAKTASVLTNCHPERSAWRLFVTTYWLARSRGTPGMYPLPYRNREFSAGSFVLWSRPCMTMKQHETVWAT